MLQCNTCGTQFERRDLRGREPRFCSRPCKVKADTAARAARYRNDADYREHHKALCRKYHGRKTERPSAYFTPSPEYVQARTEKRRATRRRYDNGMLNPTGELREGLCEACKTYHEKLNLDHDHATGATRGWLCRSCNVALGHLKDDPARIVALLSYLKRFI